MNQMSFRVLKSASIDIRNQSVELSLNINKFNGTIKQLIENTENVDMELIIMYNDLKNISSKFDQKQKMVRKLADHEIANKKMKKLVRFKETVQVKLIH